MSYGPGREEVRFRPVLGREAGFPTRGDRLQDLSRFYSVLEGLEAKLGGARTLEHCSGRMNWPRRGVYFFREDGEGRSDSGRGPRIVRVGTHALSAASRTTLWGRLS